MKLKLLNTLSIAADEQGASSSWIAMLTNSEEIPLACVALHQAIGSNSEANFEKTYSRNGCLL